jgi:hypothetical protein
MNEKRKISGFRTLVTLVVLAVLIFAGIGITSVAAQSSIPGDALYSVKTTIEQTRLGLAQDAGNRAQMRMSFAEQRLEEIRQLIQEGRYREISPAVLAFEADINNAILELETVAKGDPARAARLAMDITSALTRYARTLTTMAATAPDSVKSEVSRALDTTQIAGSLEMPTGDDNANLNNNDNGDDHGNDNANLNNNDNGDDHGNDNANLNNNDNGDDHGNDNANLNNNDNGDDHGNDNANLNNNDNGDDRGNDNANLNNNDNSDDHGNDNANLNNNDNSDDQGNDNANINNNTNDDNGGGNGGGGDSNTNDDNGGGKGGGNDNNTNDDHKGKGG